MSLYEPPKAELLNQGDQDRPPYVEANYGRLNVAITRSSFHFGTVILLVVYIVSLSTAVYSSDAAMPQFGSVATVAYIAGFLVALGRGIWLKQVWARVAGILLGIALLSTIYTAPIGAALLVMLAFGWRYRNEQMAARAIESRWGYVPLMSRYGMAFSLYGATIYLCEKVLPNFVELFSSNNIPPPEYISVLLTAAISLQLANTALWLALPPVNQRNRMIAKVFSVLAVVLLIATLYAMYSPIFSIKAS